MPQAFACAEHIDASPDTVWAALTDWPSTAEWMPGVTGMHLDAPLMVGSTVHFTARGKARSSTITALEAGSRLVLSSTVGPVRADYDYRIHSDGRGSRVSLEAIVEMSGAMRLLGPTIRASIAKEDGVQMARLKQHIESQRADAQW